MFSPTRGTDETDGVRRAYDLNEYTSEEITRFARAGFEVARRRGSALLSVDKSNVFIVGKLWRESCRRLREIGVSRRQADTYVCRQCGLPALHASGGL